MAVDPEVGIQREADQTIVAPGADLLADVEQECPAGAAIILKPDAALALPDKGPAGGIERDPDGQVPVSAIRTGNHNFRKARRKRSGASAAKAHGQANQK